MPRNLFHMYHLFSTNTLSNNENTKTTSLNNQISLAVPSEAIWTSSEAKTTAMHLSEPHQAPRNKTGTLTRMSLVIVFATRCLMEIWLPAITMM